MLDLGHPLQHSNAIKRFRKIVIRFVSFLLKFYQSGRNPDEFGLDRTVQQMRNGRCVRSKSLARLLQFLMIDGSPCLEAQSSGLIRNQSCDAFCQKQMEQRIVGRGNRTAQARLPWFLRFPAREVFGLLE